MAAIDHLVFACTDLAAGVAHIEALTGVVPAPGGPHPGVGTHNALLSLGDDVYLEIIAPDPSQPDPALPRPFGIDDLMADESAASTQGNGRLASFCIHTTPPQTIDEVAATMASHGFDPGPVSAMSRIKPAGEEIHWRLTRNASPTTCLEPFVIDWGTTTHPATVTPTGVTLISLNGSTSEPTTMRQLHSALGLPVEINDGPDELSAVLESPNGRVELR